ncbi:MAG: DUF4230 domain-containing protein [Ruminococcus sp.]|nr:DUF4230 domain-containing protein [Ruminococcus sp.]MCD7801289.1 DUF4230 domain-containing protein [Ruminococcus sp.]
MEEIKDIEKDLPKKKSLKCKMLQAFILSLLICIIAGGCFIGGVIFENSSSEEETVPTINSIQVITDVQSIGELATIKYIYTDMGKFENSQKFKDYNIPLTEKSFILSWNGTIKAGVDTTEIKIDIDEVTKVITIHLPNAKILSHETDEDSIEVFDESNNIFNPITLDDYSTFFAESKMDMEQRALDNGILDDAIENAKTVITQILNSNDDIKNLYTINFNRLDV